jgi:S1-C subfamily serine protease
MTLPDTFVAVRPATVAFISRAVRTQLGAPPPVFPDIIGTGFFVDPRGIIATNRHVVAALEQLPKHPSTGRVAAAVAVFLEPRNEDDGTVMGGLFLEIESYWVLGSFQTASRWYGEAVPDLAFVQVRAIETPALALDDQSGTLRVGMDIATAGFPLGSSVITMHGNVTQLTPMLRRGIISSVFPFQAPLPHGFTIDAMVQPGASGSPVFLPDEPKVVGVISAVLRDTASAAIASAEPTFRGMLSIPLSTNISIALPSHLIAKALRDLDAMGAVNITDVPTLTSLIPAHPAEQREFSWETFITRPVEAEPY